MSNANKPLDAASLAAQLACPSGVDGINTGVQMQAVNRNMIRKTIDRIQPNKGAAILEIGPGNAAHIDLLLQQAQGLRYFGADTSATMVGEAAKNNLSINGDQYVSFQVTDGVSLPFEDKVFDCAFTVNTLYFWKDPLAYTLEIRRVLKPAGRFYLTFAERASIMHLAFTAYGFRLYDTNEAVQLLKKAGFNIICTDTCTEEVLSNGGETVQRVFSIVTAAAAPPPLKIL